MSQREEAPEDSEQTLQAEAAPTQGDVDASAPAVNASTEPAEVAPTAEAEGRAAPAEESTQAAEGEGAQEAAEGGEEIELAPSRLAVVIESLLFAAEKPLPVKQIAEVVGERRLELIEQTLQELTAHYADRGIQIAEIAGGYQLSTAPESAFWVQKLLGKKPVRLSRAQLETLAIVSYRQPITRPEIDEIRGVDTGAVLRALLERDLVRILGKKEEPGRPLLYGTTKAFLEFFHLKDLRDLPTLREFHELTEEDRQQVGVDAEAPEVAPAVPAALTASDLPPPDLGEEQSLLDALQAAEKAVEQAASPFAPTKPPPPEPPAVE